MGIRISSLTKYERRFSDVTTQSSRQSRSPSGPHDDHSQQLKSAIVSNFVLIVLCSGMGPKNNIKLNYA